MNNLLKGFISHLFDNGLLNLDSVQTFLKIFDENRSSSQPKSVIISKTLYEFFARLNDEGLERICFDIYDKFNESFQIKLLESDSAPNNFKKNMNPKKSLNSQNFLENEYLVTTQMRKEEEELKNCTFKPTINKNISTENIQKEHKDAFNRLYQDFHTKKIKQQLNKSENDLKQSMNTPFKPKLKNNSRCLSPKDEFLQRQESFLKKIKNKKEILLNTNEEKLYNECTFSPKVNDDYQGVIHKNISTDKVKTQPNLTESNENSRKIYDPRAIDNLYSNHKQRKSRINNLREEQDKELGITFQPKLISSYRIKSTFQERNIEKKK